MAVEQGGGTIPQVTATGLSTLGYTPPAPALAPVELTAEEQALNFLNNPDELQAAAAAKANGSEYSQISSDFRNLSFLDLVDRYGERAARQRSNLVNADVAFQDNFQTNRNLGQEIGDSLISLPAGAVGIAGGLTATTLSLFGKADEYFNPENTGLSEMAVETAELTNRITGWLRGNQSEELRNRRSAQALQDSFDARDSQAQYDEEVANGSNETLATLRQFGRGVANTAETLWNEPALAADLIFEGIGSMGPSMKLAQGAAALVGRPSTAAALAQAINPTRAGAARLAATKVAERSAVPLAIGVSEASGVYPQAVAQVMGMDERQLAANSEAYVQLRNEGADHETAQRTIANNAGLLAAAVQLPIATLITGATGVSGFETGRIVGSSFVDGLREIGKQTTEEGLQGLTGTISSNYGIQQIADASQTLSENTGESLVQGAVAGLGMAGILQGPALVFDAASEGAAVVGDAAQARLDRLDQRANDRSSVGDRSTVERITLAELNINRVRTSVPTAFDSLGPLNQDDTEIMPAVVKARAVPESRLGTIQNVVDAVSDGSLSEAESLDASLFAYTELQKFQSVALDQLPPEVEALPKDDPTRVAYEQAQSDFMSIAENPKYKAIIEKAETAEQPQFDVMPQITRDLVQQTIAIAKSNPAGVNTNLIDEIMKNSAAMDESGNPIGFTLTPQETELLNNVKMMLSGRDANLSAKTVAEQERVDAINSTAPTDGAKIKARRPYDIVKDEIHIDGKRTSTAGRMLPSLNDYLRDISNSMARGGKEIQNRFGEPTTAGDSLAGLGEFAQHMKNKIDAFNRSLAGGKGKDEPVSFDTKTPSGMVKAGKKGSSSVYLDQNNPNSVFLAKEALADAVATVELYNNILSVYPQLGGTKLELPSLSDSALKLNPPIPAGKGRSVVASEATGDAQQGTQTPQEVSVPAEGFTPSSDTRGAPTAAKTPEERTGSTGDTSPVANPKPEQPKKRTWARTAEDGYEVSTRGDKRFSALNAKLKDGRTIEEAYQLDVKGYRAKSNDWKAGKGKAPLNGMTQEESYEAYKALWRQFLLENPDLKTDLLAKSEGKTLTDMFANTDISQARALSELLEETTQAEETPTQELIRIVNDSEKPGYTLAEMEPSLKAKVLETITDQAKQLGFPDGMVNDLVKDIVSMISQKKHSGHAFYKYRVMGLNAELVAAGDSPLLRKVITHELMHLIDNAARGDSKFLVSDNSRLNVGGEIHNEMLAAMEANEVLRKYFKYARSQEKKTSEIQSAELYAELGTLYVHRPDLMKEYLPRGTIFVEAVLTKAGAVPNTIVTGTGSETSTFAEGQGTTGNEDGNVGTETPSGLDGNVDQKEEGDQNEESDVLSEDGVPITFYHGTRGVFTEFNEGPTFWTTRKGLANEFALRTAGSESSPARLIQANLEIKNPFVMDAGNETELSVFSQQNSLEWQAALESGEFDSVLIFNNSGEGLVITTSNAQVLQVVEEAETEITELPQDLIKDQSGVSRFTRAYAIKKGKSILTSLAQPLNKIVSGFSSVKKLNELTGGRLDYVIERSQRLAFKKLMEENMPAIMAKLNDRLTNFKYDGDMNVIETIKAGVLDLPAQRRAKVTSLINEASGKYDQRLLEQAVMAGINWALTSSVRPDRIPSPEKAAEIFHVTEDQVTPEMIQALAFGMSQTEAKESLANMIEAFWGVQRQRDVTLSDTRGISEAMAAEIITALEGDYIVTKEFEVAKGIYNDGTGNTDTVDVKHLSISFDVPAFTQIVESLGPMRAILGDMVMGEDAKDRFIGKPATKISATQRRNPFSKNSPSQVEALKNLHQLEFRRNEPFINMMTALGREAYMRIKGTVDLENTLVNKMDRKSIEGKNLSNTMSWDGVMDHDAAIKSYADLNSVEANLVPSYFKWDITKVGRHMMLGFGPQADKTSREALVATISELDLNEDADRAYFWMSVGQSIGMKIEKKYRADNVAAAEAKMDEEYANSVSIMREWLNDQSQPLSDVDTAIVEMEMRDAGEGTDKAMHAILAVAMYRNALAAGGDAASQFEHKLSLEADGKTDGPINAMMHFISGRFEQGQFDLLSKGGFFMNQRGKTLNDHFQVDDLDLYQVAANKLRDALAEKVKSLREQKSPALPYMEAIQRLTVAYSGTAISFDNNGDLVIGRNILKNPLTVTVYGSGSKGINGKVVQALMEAMYANMTMEMNGDANATKFSQYEADINLLFGFKLYFWKGKYGINKDPVRISREFTLENFEFSPLARANFEANMKLLFTDFMYDAINEMMGSTTDTMKLFQKATQVQSIVMMDYFKRRIAETLTEKYESGELKGKFVVTGREDTGEKLKSGKPKYNRLKEEFATYNEAMKFAASATPEAGAKVNLEGEFLSQADYDRIFKELEKFGAIVENDEYTLNMGTSETAESNRVFSSDFNGKLRGEARLPAPSRAGVKAAPYITIARGDGVMINNIYRLENYLKNSLPVYDGVELAANRIEEDSALINKAVADGWAQNPAMDVSNSFAAFLRESPLSNLSEDAQFELQRALDSADINVLENDMFSLNNQLIEVAQSIEARKMTIQQIMYSVDHMAGAESPFTNEDGVILEGTPEEVLEQINAMYETNLARIQNKKPPLMIGRQDKPFQKLVKKFGFKNATNDVTELNREGFLELMEATKEEMTSDQRKVYDIIKDTMDPETKFIIGSVEEVTAYRNRVYPEKNDGKDIPQGQIDVDNLLIYMTSQTVETALHEMVHATTLGKVSAYFTNKSALNQKEVDALDRMIALMEDFRNRDFLNDSTAMRDAALDAQNQIAEALKLPNESARQVAALNEFMAWSLSNQELINAAKATRNKNPLAVIAEKLLRLMGRLVGGDIFSNILFNTQILVERPIRYDEFEGPSSMVLNHLSGSSQRLYNLMESFETKVAHWIRQRVLADPNSNAEDQQLIYEAAAAGTINLLAANGFDMTPDEQSAFAAIQVGMATSMEIDPLVLQRSQRLYNHVMSQITVESFMADETDATQRPLAERKYRALTGKAGLEFDEQGNSNLISIFLGLAQVNDEVRVLLKDIKLPKSVDINRSSADNFLYSLTNSMMETLSITATKEGRHNGNVSEALDRLTVALGQIEKNDANRVEAIVNPLLNKGDKKGADLLMRLGEAVWQFGDTRVAQNSSLVRSSMVNAAKTLGALINQDRGGDLARSTVSLMNSGKAPLLIKEFVADVIGMTNDNRAVLMMVNLGKKLVSATRQDFRETLPEVFKKQFKRKLTEEVQTIMHRAMGKTDLVALIDMMSVAQMAQLFRSNLKVIDGIRDLESELKTLDSVNLNEYKRKSEQLAKYMMTGVPGHNLLKNATAISKLLNSNSTPRNGSPQLVKVIDQLTTMYAIQMMDRGTKDVMAELVQNESAGVEFMLHYIKDLRDAEIKKGLDYGNDVAVLNGYKSYIPSEVQDGTKLIVTDAAGAIKQARLGFTEIGKYTGPGYRVGSANMVYMYSATSGRSTYSQGAMQTVELSVNGVDPLTGRSLTGNTAGMITGPSVRVINRKMRSANQNTNLEEALMPIFDGNGQVVAFERALHPDMLEKLNRNTNLGEMIGAWRGRQAEEELGAAFNESLVDQIKKNWDELKDTRRDEFVDLSSLGKDDDKIWKDSWAMVPRSTRDYIESVFGTDGFPVQRTLVNNVVGYRDASVSDIFTGQNRLDEKTNKVVENTMRVFMGDKSMQYMLIGEKGIQTAVSFAKDLIIIKSVVVPALNFASNIGQLLVRGVPAVTVLKSTRAKLVEINAYLKNQSRRVELEAIIKASASEPYKIRRAEVELQSMLDQERRMSIHALIQAGEFSTISEGMTDLDDALTNGKFADWTESLVNRFPGPARTVGKYALITRDTALYQGMSRAVQYGDFLGKSILYDHYTGSQGLSHEEAMKKITEEFVNYNLLPGRIRGFSESIGLIWFQHFKVRSMKVAHSMMVNNPLRALLFSIGSPMNPVEIDVGSLLSDNLVSVTASGRLPYSLGYDMLWRAPSLNPFIGGFF